MVTQPAALCQTEVRKEREKNERRIGEDKLQPSIFRRRTPKKNWETGQTMSKKADPNALTDQQELFCLEYLKDTNGKQAAIRAGYSDKSAEQQASRLLSNPKVSERVKQLLEERTRQVGVDVNEILSELKRLGYSDLRKLFDEDGAIRPVSEWPEELARAVSSIEVFEEFEFVHGGFNCPSCDRVSHKRLIGQTKKVKFWSKPHALEMLGRHKKLFTDKFEFSASNGLADRLAEAIKKSEEDK